MEEQIEKLQQQLRGQENELLQLKDLDAKKEKLMLDLKSKCTEMAKNWSEELQKSRNEVARLKAENQAAKEVRVDEMIAFVILYQKGIVHK